ncbi:unnamed protein product [Rotaria sp. Silwood1]|nr:unnamed protein product [Rotaria sp. Silwood1]CAF1289828.1 unnamed protein product [Rotaria sp. Silwood1]CAF3497185.1 unnamed protein product [Rotaria sp. Silwood1]CAF3527438.1 unnamed protein product [Rotaria sp. Silwood1]CAF4660398.1 unnamed protein product [Rotaria sp. Silwood1]
MSSNNSSVASSSSSSSSNSNTNSTYESSLDQLRSLLPNSNAKGMSDYDVVRSATDYIQTLMKDTGNVNFQTRLSLCVQIQEQEILNDK